MRPNQIQVIQAGRQDYRACWELQQRLAAARRAGHIPDLLLLVEHPPTYTIGRRGTRDHLLINEARLHEVGATCLKVDRGGDITFHGPGQLVAYPIVELKEALDLRRYVRSLEQAVIATAGRFEVEAGRVDGLTGVWVDESRKLAAIGVRVRRAVTTHGLALNVNTNLRWFDEMVPCGIRDKGVTSLAAELGHPVEMEVVESVLAEELAAAFGLRLADGLPGILGPAGAIEQ